jgi:hypothetical protein
MNANCSLEALHSKLRQAGYEVSMRGSGAGQFLFLENAGRAVESSIHSDGSWWIEVWERSDDENAGPVEEHWADPDDEALALISAWLE